MALSKMPAKKPVTYEELDALVSKNIDTSCFRLSAKEAVHRFINEEQLRTLLKSDQMQLKPQQLALVAERSRGYVLSYLNMSEKLTVEEARFTFFERFVERVHKPSEGKIDIKAYKERLFNPEFQLIVSGILTNFSTKLAENDAELNSANFKEKVALGFAIDAKCQPIPCDTTSTEDGGDRALLEQCNKCSREAFEILRDSYDICMYFVHLSHPLDQSVEDMYKTYSMTHLPGLIARGAHSMKPAQVGGAFWPGNAPPEEGKAFDLAAAGGPNSVKHLLSLLTRFYVINREIKNDSKAGKRPVDWAPAVKVTPGAMGPLDIKAPMCAYPTGSLSDFQARTIKNAPLTTYPVIIVRMRTKDGSVASVMVPVDVFLSVTGKGEFELVCTLTCGGFTPSRENMNQPVARLMTILGVNPYSTHKSTANKNDDILFPDLAAPAQKALPAPPKQLALEPAAPAAPTEAPPAAAKGKPKEKAARSKLPPVQEVDEVEEMEGTEEAEAAEDAENAAAYQPVEATQPFPPESFDDDDVQATQPLEAEEPSVSARKRRPLDDDDTEAAAASPSQADEPSPVKPKKGKKKKAE